MPRNPFRSLRTQFRAGLWVVALAVGILGPIGVGFHHHNDFDSHDDCPVCEVAQNPSIAPDQPCEVVIAQIAISSTPQLAETSPRNTAPALVRLRGPPLV